MAPQPSTNVQIESGIGCAGRHCVTRTNLAARLLIQLPPSFNFLPRLAHRAARREKRTLVAPRNLGARHAIMVAFDIMEVESCDARAAAQRSRRMLSDAADGIMPSQWLEGDGPTVFEAACGLGLEGIVSKRLGTKYQSGRCANWLKTKNGAFVRR